MPCAAHPENASFQAALIWRADGTGQYLLPDLTGKTTYQAPDAILTTDQIETLTATWIFDGAVDLELSVDGGLHYTPAVNGVPLTVGSPSGNQLKWRATMGAESHLFEVKIVHTDRSGARGSFGEPKLSGFTFRKPMLVTGSTAGTLVHYQLQLAIGESEATVAYDVHCQGRARSDFGDIRITAADGQTILPHYVERILGASPGRLAVVWVNIPQLPQNGVTLYLYYGNADAQNLSDGRAVFDFFEDFHGDSLNPKVWETRIEGQGSATVSTMQLHVTSASILSKEFQMTDGIIESLATTQTGQDDARLIIRSDRSASHPDETNQVAYASSYGGAEHVIAVGNIVKANDPKPLAAGIPYGYRVIAHGGALTFQRFDEMFTKSQASVAFHDADGLMRGAVGLHSDGTAAYEWIRVRQLADPAPAVMTPTTPISEETVDLPVFLNTLIAPNGALTLANPSLEGVYEMAGIATPVLIRVLMPHWEGQVDRADLSTDGGASYRLKCLIDTHYYASKKAFIPGKRLKARLILNATDETSAPLVRSFNLDYDAGQIVVVSPNGRERWPAGSTHEVTWSARGHESSYPMKLDYSLDAGKTYQPITASALNTGAYLWKLPQDMASGAALVRIADGYDLGVSDTSDGVFSIGSVGSAVQDGSEQGTPADAAHPEAGSEASFSDDLLGLLDTLSTDPRAIPHDVVIKVTDSNSALGYHPGDIVMIRPSGTEWSEAEKASFLILQARLSPEAVSMLTSPIEMPTGERDKAGEPVMRMTGRRKFRIDLGAFDLKPKPGDKGNPPVLRHYKKQQDLKLLMEDRTKELTNTPAHVPHPAK